MKTNSDSGPDYAALLIGGLRMLGFLGLIVVLTPVQLLYLGRKSADPRRIPLLFHRILIRILGFRIRTYGVMASPKQSPVMFVSNHTSYLDVPVLGALIPAPFVAKAEVSEWPFFGILAKLQQTIFIERRSTEADRQRNGLRQHLEEGHSLILFPEGTSSVGLSVLPFKSSLFSVVEGKLVIPVKVQAISITCTELDGMPITRGWRSMYAWYGDMTLSGHLWNVFKYGRFTINVVFHPPVDPGAFASRKMLAVYCQQQVARGIEQSLIGREAPMDMPQLPPPRDALLPAK